MIDAVEVADAADEPRIYRLRDGFDATMMQAAAVYAALEPTTCGIRVADGTLTVWSIAPPVDAAILARSLVEDARRARRQRAIEARDAWYDAAAQVRKARSKITIKRATEAAQAAEQDYKRAAGEVDAAEDRLVALRPFVPWGYTAEGVAMFGSHPEGVDVWMHDPTRAEMRRFDVMQIGDVVTYADRPRVEVIALAQPYVDDFGRDLRAHRVRTLDGLGREGWMPYGPDGMAPVETVNLALAAEPIEEIKP